jgi:arginyl-tRNA synthetase
MILLVHDTLRTHIARLLTAMYSLDAAAAPPVVLEYPPNRDLGDLGTPVAFELARRLRKPPRVIAQEIAGAFGSLEGVRQVSAAPNGYLNVFLARVPFLLDRLAAEPPARLSTASHKGVAGKAIVEHTAINPNKAAHIGHLRNSALGDTLVRVLRFRGIPVEVQNYIDDTGVQVADVVVGFRVIEQKTLDEIRAIADTTQFDYYCWDLYAKVTDWYGEDAPRHRARWQRERRHRRVRRRPDRALPFEDDGEDERRLRPPDVGGRHPAPHVLGTGLRRPQGQGRGASSNRRAPRRMLGDADPGGAGGKSQVPNPKSRTPSL